MSLSFFDYEIPVLKALLELGGFAPTGKVYPLVEFLMHDQLQEHPEQYGLYKSGQIIWKNKTRWAREYLKRKEQLDGSKKGLWTLTEAGRARLKAFARTGKDPDEGKATVEGIDPSAAEISEDPKKFFDKAQNTHETGDILNIRGIVYEPTNEQGVVSLFTALCYDLNFRLEGIRSKFPDAILKRRNDRGNFSPCLAEFEFKSSNYQLHKHPIKGCDLVICWEHDWKKCPIEVLELKKVVRDFK